MQYRRALLPGATYFFTVNLANRTNGILIKEIDSLLYAIRTTKAQYPFKIVAYAILPDHLHLIMILPEHDSNYSLRWSMIKSLFSKQIPCLELISPARKNKRERGIWQRRFWEHLIRDELDLEHHVNYIHFNPVKHGYVPKASDWKYSSIHRYIQKGIITSDWACSDTVHTTNQFGE
ncbi:TPA: transposase [Legionella pneumophila]|nr:transposase [Legionella pneumophila]HAU1322435.1 transposase [Legionella pneumophila]HBC0467275.1 transposase [Legionella pneumophila]HBD9376211.1 transposase [Legionella pneumophila]HBI2948068.1 transposase [Legionella pneumophila]